MWRFRLFELRREMEVKLKRKIGNQELADAAGVSLPTLNRWLAKPVVSAKSEHVWGLATFFNVAWYQVIEPVDMQP